MHRIDCRLPFCWLVVLDKGRIVETGAHAELIAHEGQYARLWKRQTGGFVAAEDELVRS